MAYAGQVIENPVTGERITFRQTAADTDGELLAFDLELSPDGAVPGLHVHPSQEERFEIVSGRMKFRKGMKKIEAEAGDVVTVEPSRAHKFANAGDETAVVRDGPPRGACRSRSTSRSSAASTATKLSAPSRPSGFSAPLLPRSPSSRASAATAPATRRCAPRSPEQRVARREPAVLRGRRALRLPLEGGSPAAPGGGLA